MAICRYSLAVNRSYRREGEPDADFINCVAFAKRGEFAERFFKKGMMVAVEGSLRTNSWDDKESGQRRYSTEVIVDNQYFAESKSSFESRRNAGGDDFDQSPPPQRQAPQNNFNQSFDETSGFSSMAEDIDDDDLPF
jgi:single-strand DNA-binding protein